MMSLSNLIPKILMRSLKTFPIVFSIFILTSCQTEKPNPNYQVDAANTDYFHRSMKKLTDVIVHDIISPPVAARDY